MHPWRPPPDCKDGCAVDLCKYKTPTGGETLVAVKRLRPSIIRNKAELKNFVEETKLLRKLHHRYLRLFRGLQNRLACTGTHSYACLRKACHACICTQDIAVIGPSLRHAYRYITKYVGVGGRLEASLDDEEQAKDVLEHMFLVQEYLDGGNLRKQVLEQVLSPSGYLLDRPSCCECRRPMPILRQSIFLSRTLSVQCADSICRAACHCRACKCCLFLPVYKIMVHTGHTEGCEPICGRCAQLT